MIPCPQNFVTVDFPTTWDVASRGTYRSRLVLSRHGRVTYHPKLAPQPLVLSFHPSGAPPRTAHRKFHLVSRRVAADRQNPVPSVKWGSDFKTRRMRDRQRFFYVKIPTKVVRRRFDDVHGKAVPTRRVAEWRMKYSPALAFAPVGLSTLVRRNDSVPGIRQNGREIDVSGFALCTVTSTESRSTRPVAGDFTIIRQERSPRSDSIFTVCAGAPVSRGPPRHDSRREGRYYYGPSLHASTLLPLSPVGKRPHGSRPWCPSAGAPRNRNGQSRMVF